MFQRHEYKGIGYYHQSASFGSRLSAYVLHAHGRREHGRFCVAQRQHGTQRPKRLYRFDAKCRGKLSADLARVGTFAGKCVRGQAGAFGHRVRRTAHGRR